jgi:hypothetical protein
MDSNTSLTERKQAETKPPLITVCHACGREFGKRAKLTISRSFVQGTPRDEQIVHSGCEHSRLRRLTVGDVERLCQAWAEWNRGTGPRTSPFRADADGRRYFVVLSAASSLKQLRANPLCVLRRAKP